VLDAIRLASAPPTGKFLNEYSSYFSLEVGRENKKKRQIVMSPNVSSFSSKSPFFSKSTNLFIPIVVLPQTS